MIALALSVLLALGVSFACALLEAALLSTSIPEIEALKKLSLRRGHALEKLKTETGETVATLRALDTIASLAGAALVGGFVVQQFGSVWLGLAAGALALTAVVISEVIPKNLGVVYREKLLPPSVRPMLVVRKIFYPLAYLANLSARLASAEKSPKAASSDDEIILLAERSAKEGKLTPAESRMIANALTLDDVRVADLMTPRTVVTALEKSATVADVFRELKTIPFARIPVYTGNFDHVVGLVRRRDLLKAKANDLDQQTVGELMQEVHFIPETVSAAAALQMCLKTHTQLLVVVDEFGSVAGVITMEEIMEHILGKEIFEKDDVAVDMRELARSRRASRGAAAHGGGAGIGGAAAATPPRRGVADW